MIDISHSTEAITMPAARNEELPIEEIDLTALGLDLADDALDLDLLNLSDLTKSVNSMPSPLGSAALGLDLPSSGMGLGSSDIIGGRRLMLDDSHDSMDLNIPSAIGRQRRDSSLARFPLFEELPGSRSSQFNRIHLPSSTPPSVKRRRIERTPLLPKSADDMFDAMQLDHPSEGSMMIRDKDDEDHPMAMGNDQNNNNIQSSEMISAKRDRVSVAHLRDESSSSLATPPLSEVQRMGALLSGLDEKAHGDGDDAKHAEGDDNQRTEHKSDDEIKSDSDKPATLSKRQRRSTLAERKTSESRKKRAKTRRRRKFPVDRQIEHKHGEQVMNTLEEWNQHIYPENKLLPRPIRAAVNVERNIGELMNEPLMVEREDDLGLGNEGRLNREVRRQIDLMNQEYSSARGSRKRKGIPHGNGDDEVPEHDPSAMPDDLPRPPSVIDEDIDHLLPQPSANQLMIDSEMESKMAIDPEIGRGASSMSADKSSDPSSFLGMPIGEMIEQRRRPIQESGTDSSVEAQLLPSPDKRAAQETGLPLIPDASDEGEGLMSEDDDRDVPLRLQFDEDGGRRDHPSDHTDPTSSSSEYLSAAHLHWTAITAAFHGLLKKEFSEDGVTQVEFKQVLEKNKRVETVSKFDQALAFAQTLTLANQGFIRVEQTEGGYAPILIKKGPHFDVSLFP